MAVFEHEAQAGLAQMAVDAKTNEHKAALQLLDMIDVQDKVITGDAAFCQRDLSGKIAEKGAYLRQVKDNQPPPNAATPPAPQKPPPWSAPLEN